MRMRIVVTCGILCLVIWSIGERGRLVKASAQTNSAPTQKTNPQRSMYGEFTIVLEPFPPTEYSKLQACSFLFDWGYYRYHQGGSRAIPYVYTERLEVHKAMIKFLSACDISYAANPLLPPMRLPYTSPKAREYFVTRLFQTWLNGNRDTDIWPLYHSLHYSTNSIDTLIKDYGQFSTLFPKDRYLGAYAKLCQAVLLAISTSAERDSYDSDVAERFTKIEEQYPDIPELGIVSSWWKAMYLLQVKQLPRARQTFAHIANRYKKHDWWIVETATKASKGARKEWEGMYMIRKPEQEN